MSGMWNRTLVYLGLREEPEEVYGDLPERFVPEDDPHAEHAPPRRTGTGSSGGTYRFDAAQDAETTDHGSARQQGGGQPATRPDESNVRPLRTGDVHLRPAPSSASRAAVVEVARFDDVEAIGARYRTGQPVLFDVSRADAATGRRVVDFVSGLTFALRGRLTKVGRGAFLLLPDGVELPSDERRRLDDLGYRVSGRSGS